ncbi:NUDIX domain-containing protein [Schaalia sp. ZJ1691]|uniref:NUDIX domain-containing protein n=1 Tax=Schaalia sp. ZJ1691 TaxID=2709404 RepID=UPI0013EA10AB
MTLRPVIAAAIVDSLAAPTHLLCAARAYPEELRGKYELPGGKIEDGETPENALRREIREELSIDLTLGDEVLTDSGEWWPLMNGRLMGVRLAEIAFTTSAPHPHRESVIKSHDSHTAHEKTLPTHHVHSPSPSDPRSPSHALAGRQVPRLGDSHIELRWVPLESTDTLNWIDADFDIIRQIQEICRARPRH